MPVKHRRLVGTAKAVSYLLGWLLVLFGASVLISAWSVAFPGPGLG